MEIDDPVRLDTRLAGQLRRYHTWPILGQQTVAEHTWQLLRIYTTVVDDISPAVIFRIIFHDVGEHITGDLPYPVKKDNPTLKTEVSTIEQQSCNAQFKYWDVPEHEVRIDRSEEILIKQIELIEMAEFGLDQMCLGNQHGMIVASRCLKAVYEAKPPPYTRLVQYVINRLHLFYHQHRNLDSYPLEEWWFADKWRKLHERK